MRWFLGMMLAAGIFAVAIVPTLGDRVVVASRITVAACSADLAPEVGGDPSLSYTLRLAEDSRRLPEDVTADQLIRFGFDRHTVAMLGEPRPVGMDLPTPRPLWVRLRADSQSGDRLIVEHVGAQREPAGAHPNSIELLARVGFVEEVEVMRPTPGDSSQPEPEHPRSGGGKIRTSVLELIPHALHLSSEQYQALKADTSGFDCASSPHRLVIAMGRNGSLWVEQLLPR